MFEIRGEIPFIVKGASETTGEKEFLYYNPTGDNSISSFRLLDKSCSISDDTISISLPAGTDVTGLVADFAVQKDAAVYVDNTLQKSGYSRNDFSKPVEYRVVADSGEERIYTVNVTLMSKPASSGGGGGGGNRGTVISNKPVKEPPEEEKAPVLRKLFSDVDETHWAFDSIDMLKAKNVVSGYPDGKFMPENKVTRAEFVKMIVNAFTLVPGSLEDKEFSDVTDNDWFKYYVSIAITNGLIKGNDNNLFGAYDNITREDMAVILWRLMGSASSQYECEFIDKNDISYYAKEAINYLCENGLFRGYGDNTVRSKDTATRAEVCSIIFEVIKEEKIK